MHLSAFACPATGTLSCRDYWSGATDPAVPEWVPGQCDRYAGECGKALLIRHGPPGRSYPPTRLLAVAFGR